jgi:SlyX protein
MSGHEALEARIVELESRTAFQDDLLANLDRTVAQLGDEVVGLRKLCNEMREALETVRLALSHDVASEPPPPHY